MWPLLDRNTHHPRRQRLWGSGYFRRIGPGLVTGAADDDPSGIGTYSQVGATSGNQLLWSAPALLPFAFAVQETCARLALVTGRGLASLIRQRLPRPVLYLAVAAVALANSFNIAADLGSMSAALGLLIPIPQALGVLLFASGVAITEVLIPYHRYARFLKWLCISLLAYVGVLAVAHVNWPEVIHSTLVPHLSFTKTTMVALIALSGTTISPTYSSGKRPKRLRTKGENPLTYHANTSQPCAAMFWPGCVLRFSSCLPSWLRPQQHFT
jgi:NRAMP (natural resistance-associated macrophage protein)-like metal ion transporter